MPISGSSRNPKYWPTPQDYNEAVQNLHAAARDRELRSAQVETGRFGLPKPITGGFACVYKAQAKERQLAVRCFLRNIPDLERRYQAVSEFLKAAGLKYTADFDYQSQGIVVHGRHYPILKMEWVEGITLDDFVRTAVLMHKELDEAICEGFKQLCLNLGAAGLAHGDLQHGNLLVNGQNFMLVDYDGMYVPALAGSTSNELGHRHYQHPKRTATHFGPDLDNFSAWVIYVSLKALSVDANLLRSLDGGDDCLLFRQADFLEPTRSRAFSELEHHSSRELRQLSRYLRWLLLVPANEIPPLSEAPTIPLRLLPVQYSKGALHHQDKPIANDSEKSVPDWLAPTNIVQLSSNDQHRGSSRGELKPDKSKVSSHPKLAQIELMLLQKAGTVALPRELRFIQPRRLSTNPRLEMVKLAMIASALISCATCLLMLYAHIAGPMCLAAISLSVLMVLLIGEQLPIASPIEKTLLSTGDAVPGLLVEKTHQDDPYLLDFVYLHDGQPKAAQMQVGGADFRHARRGQLVTVLYNRNTDDAVIYEFCAYRRML